MSRLLEILGRGMEVDISDLIWHWLGATKLIEDQTIDPQQLERLDKIACLVSQNKEETATEELRLYLFDYPSCTIGRIAAAALYLSNNQLENAIEELNSVYMRHPNNTMALYALGHCYERLGREAQAIEFYQDCLKFKNYLQLPRYRLAALYFKNEQIEKTIEEYKLLRNEYPDDITSLVTLGYLFIASHDYPNAIDAFNKAILIHPDNFHFSDTGLERLICDGELQDALELVNDLLNEQSDRADLLVKKGDILAMLGDSGEAQSYYEQANQMCPDFLEAAIKLGTQYLQSSQHEAAAKKFQEAIEINDRIVDAYIGLATAYKASNNEIQALSTLSLAAAIQPNSSLLFSESANLEFQISGFGRNVDIDHQDSGQVIEAILTAHKQQIKTGLDDPDVFYRYGMLLMGVNRMSDAAEAFDMALRLNPTYYRAKTKLSICLLEIGQEKLALEYFDLPYMLSSETLELHYKLSLLYCDSFKFASSLLNLEQNMQNSLAIVDTTVNLSVVLQNLGLIDRAVTMGENLGKTANQHFI
ncbi:MAG: tetratricopeptide repeat protein [Planctomycetota bacterium]|jgi:tetratricopeptide (TPR) repeat protein